MTTIYVSDEQWGSGYGEYIFKTDLLDENDKPIGWTWALRDEHPLHRMKAIDSRGSRIWALGYMKGRKPFPYCAGYIAECDMQPFPYFE